MMLLLMPLKFLYKQILMCFDFIYVIHYFFPMCKTRLKECSQKYKGELMRVYSIFRIPSLDRLYIAQAIASVTSVPSHPVY